MDQKTIVPTFEEIKSFLEGFGWNYKETTHDGQPVAIAPFLTKENKGILLSLRVEGEFVMVSTVGLLKNVPVTFGKDLLEIGDTIKLVKIFVTHQDSPETMNAEVGFELWGEAWNKQVFYVFMDTLCMGIEHALDKVNSQNIPHETNFITLN